MINTMLHFALVDFRYTCIAPMEDTSIHRELALQYFSNGRGSIRTFVTNEAADHFYNTYVSRLTEGHEKLKDRFQ
jgi:hypothetical protein